MATPNLGITEVSEAQNQKHITINDAITKLDNATQGTASYTITTDTTLTSTQFTETFNHVLGGTPASAFDLNTTATSRFFCVTNNTGQTATVQVVGGAGLSVEVSNSEVKTLYSNGTDISLISSASASTNPYDFGFYFKGSPTDAQEVFRFKAVRSFTIPDGAPGSTGSSRVASTGSVDFSVTKNGTQFATVNFNASASGTWSFDASADEVFSTNDIFAVLAPATADASLEDISIIIKGER